MGIRWLELLSGLGGAAVGGGAGYLIGGPKGAQVGVGLGFQTGLGLHPGGFRDPEPLPTLGTPALGARLEEIATRERESIRAGVGAQLSSALRQSSIEAAQAGRLRSGTAGTERTRLREAALRATATASAGVGLQTEALRQRALQAEQAFQLQVAQLQARKDAAQTQMLTSIFAAGAELAPDFLKWIGGGGDQFDFSGMDADQIAFDASMIEPLPQNFGQIF